jgi:hypothetical protein
MPDEDHHSVGLAPYAAGGRSAAQTVLAKLEVKCRLRSELAKVEAELSAMVAELPGAALQELQHLILQSADAADRDVAALQAQVAAESSLAETTKAAVVIIPRRAAAALAAEAEKRIQRGVFPSTESLVGEAIVRAYGQ